MIGTAHEGPVLDEKEGFRVIACRECGFRHLNPIPSEEFLEEFYRRVYYDSHKSDYLEKENREDAYWRIAYTERLAGFSKWAPGRDLLDVGCGGGAFLRFAAERGWKVAGVEPSAAAAAAAAGSGLDVYHGTLDSFRKADARRFHVVHLKNVLEHVRDPASVIGACRSLLHQGGILYVEVPNDYDLVQRVGVRIVGQRRAWVTVPDHINYFSFRSAEKLLRKGGFRMLARDTTFPMYLFLWFGMDFIARPATGARAHAFRIRFETALERAGLGSARRAAYRLLARLSLGRTAILFARKEETDA